MTDTLLIFLSSYPHPPSLRPTQDAILASSTRPHHSPIPNRRVLNPHRHPDILRPSQPQLATDAKPPAVRFAVTRDRDTMV